MKTTVRIYGNVINTWYRNDEKHVLPQMIQKEVEYKEYSIEDGTLVNVGTEDFTPERWKQEVEFKEICTWDGKSFNKGGQKKFNSLGHRYFRKSERKERKAYAMVKYAEAAVIQFR